MKKAIKWTAFFLVLACLVIYTVSGIFAPEQTKQLTDTVVSWLNTPVGIAGVSTTIGGIISYVIVNFVMKNSKFGRKELDNIKNDNNAFKDEVNKYREQINEYKDKAVAQIEEYKNKFEETKKECENKVTVMYEEFNDAQKMLVDSLKTIPNKKVQAIVAEYEAKFNIRKEEIISKTINTNEYINTKIKELDDNYKEFIEKMEKMLNEKAINSETEVK